VSGQDIALLMCAPGHIAHLAPSDDSDLRRRYLAIIVDGLRPPS
jgi:hypothetical protein